MILIMIELRKQQLFKSHKLLIEKNERDFKRKRTIYKVCLLFLHT